MIKSKKAVMILLLSGLAGVLWAHEGDMMSAASPASKEFEQIKQLAGNWAGTSKDSDGKTGPVTTEYRVTAAGSAVEEHLMKGTPHEMVDMYDDEAGKLAMTHFCAFGNHPHLLVKEAAPGRIVLEMGPTVGIDAAKDQHMHELVLEFPDANHLTQRWTCYKDGKPYSSTVFTMTRTKSPNG